MLYFSPRQIFFEHSGLEVLIASMTWLAILLIFQRYLYTVLPTALPSPQDPSCVLERSLPCVFPTTPTDSLVQQTVILYLPCVKGQGCSRPRQALSLLSDR